MSWISLSSIVLVKLIIRVNYSQSKLFCHVMEDGSLGVLFKIKEKWDLSDFQMFEALLQSQMFY